MGKRAAALPEPGDTVAEKYRIECTIGTGGMSVVYGATHLITGRRFAIKWMCPEPGNDTGESTQRFIREAQVAGRFAHPNVVEVYDVGQVEGAYFMVMEWLEGESLAARLDRDGALSFEEACDLLIPCMYGIDDAHNAGIVHRDLKPANIFLCPATRHAPARAKVLDFGIAKLMDQARRDSSPEHRNGKFNPLVTQVGTLMGTPYYLAPEQLRNHPADRRTDIYAFGVIMYQVLAGRVPFTGNTFADLVVQISSFTPRSLRELARALPTQTEHVVARAMARDPDLRYQDLRSLAGALEAVQSGALERVLEQERELERSQQRGLERRLERGLEQERSQERLASHAHQRSSVRTAAGGVASTAVAAIRTHAARFAAPEPSGPFGLARPLSVMHSSGVQPVSGRLRIPLWAVWCSGVVLALLLFGVYKRWSHASGAHTKRLPPAVVSPRPLRAAAPASGLGVTGSKLPTGSADMYQAATAQDAQGGAALPRGSEGPLPVPATQTVQNTPVHAGSPSPSPSVLSIARKKPSTKTSGLSLPDLPEPEADEEGAAGPEVRRAPAETPTVHRKRPAQDEFDSEEDINPLQGMRLQ